MAFRAFTAQEEPLSKRGFINENNLNHYKMQIRLSAVCFTIKGLIVIHVGPPLLAAQLVADNSSQFQGNSIHAGCSC